MHISDIVFPKKQNYKNLIFASCIKDKAIEMVSEELKIKT